MTPLCILMRTGLASTPPSQFFWGWIALCTALAVHIFDEACTGFLSVYNPTVMALRQRRPWLPLPVYTFGAWLAGLVAGNAMLFGLSYFALRGFVWMRPLGFIFAAILLINGLVHIGATVRGRTVESVHFRRPISGTYSSPLMLLASIYMLYVL